MNNKINSLIYLNHGVTWCKVLPLELESRYEGSEAIQLYRENPKDKDLLKQTFDAIIEWELSLNHTPEYFMYDNLIETSWSEINLAKAEEFTDLFISESLKRHLQYLEDIYPPTDAKNAAKHLVDYQQLKTEFFRETFDTSQVHFYTNSSIENFETDMYDYPCIIAVDSQKIGFLWYMS